MRTKLLCQGIVDHQLKSALTILISDADKLSEEEFLKAIRDRINDLHITMNVLRTFSAIYLFEKTKGQGIPLDCLMQILIVQDSVTSKDVDHSLTRLKTERIIKIRDNTYMLSEI